MSSLCIFEYVGNYFKVMLHKYAWLTAEAYSSNTKIFFSRQKTDGIPVTAL